MEIISYVGTSSVVKKNSPGIQLQFPRFKRKKSARTYTERAFSEKRILSRQVLKIENQFRKAGIISFLALLFSAFLLAVVPCGVFSVLSYFENHASPLRFENMTVSETEALTKAMSQFAMETSYGSVDENGNVLADDGSVVASANMVFGEPVTYSEYVVKSGDSISTISRKFGLSNISTLIAVNRIENVRTVRVGQKLKIPSQDGIIYKVAAGDSLNALSVRFHVSLEELLDANDLSSEHLAVGTELFIPGARMDPTSLKRAMGELFVCPITASWRLTSRFGPRADPFTGVASNHTGVDMACPQGTPIRASMSGTVVYVGWSNVFGNYVIINHGNGYQSLYGHMLKTSVKNGQAVDQNTRIGLVGSTGYSTGPHLHFTVYKNGKLVDPMTLLKK